MIKKIKAKLIALFLSLVYKVYVKVEKLSYYYFYIEVNRYRLFFDCEKTFSIENREFERVYSNFESSIKELIWFIKAIKNNTVLFIEELDIPGFYEEDIEQFKDLLTEIKLVDNINKVNIEFIERLFVVINNYFTLKYKYVSDKEKFELEQKKAKFELTKQVFEAIKKIYPTVKYFIIY